MRSHDDFLNIWIKNAELTSKLVSATFEKRFMSTRQTAELSKIIFRTNISTLWPLPDKYYPGWGRARNRLWSDRPRQVWPLIRPSQTEVTSDQTSVRSKIVVRSKCARSRLWSDEFQTEVTPDQTSSRPLPRQVPDHCPDEFQTIVQTKVRSKYCPRPYAWMISADLQ